MNESEEIALKPSTLQQVGANKATVLPLSPGTPAAWSCRTTFDKTYSAKWATVGATFVSGGSNAKGTYTFSKGGSTSVGVALSATGKSGSFTKGGTASVSTDIQIKFTNNGGNKLHKVQVIPARYSTLCQNLAGSGVKLSYQVKPYKLTGGNDSTTTSVFATDKYCVKLAKNNSFEMSKSKASTRSTGFNISSIVGFNTSSQSGYTSKSTIQYEAGKKDRKICGQNGYPAGSPGNIKMK